MLFKIAAFVSIKKHRLDFPPAPTETTINSVLIAIQCVCLSIHTVNRTLFITASSKIGLHLSLSADGVLVFVLPLNFSPLMRDWFWCEHNLTDIRAEVGRVPKTWTQVRVLIEIFTQIKVIVWIVTWVRVQKYWIKKTTQVTWDNIAYCLVYF